MFCGVCGAAVFESPHGIVCENGHGAPPLVSASGAPIFEPLPDAALPHFDPERARTVEARCTALSGQVAQLRRALREMLTHSFLISDKGTASWYQGALRALQVGADT